MISTIDPGTVVTPEGVVSPILAALAVREALDRSPALDATDLVVTPTGPTLVLAGTVRHHADRLAARQLARLAATGLPVDERIRVETRIGPRAEDRDTAAEVARRLAEAGYPLPGVEVDHRVAHLRGAVPSWCARCTVRHIVETTPGVDVVDERLTVTGGAV
ncbi:MAG: BON domain-containing protein [Actinomycetales bacterium]|nr:BON domain-containing protein [Actinomycetales bacterium]